ncbi:MAG: TIR domain-containing protein [Myxococcales bacterium]|nr:TIR domain-containing protein [Myxococcales bacterium]
MSVFIAHSNRDKPLARRIAEKLRSRDIEVFLDEDSLPAGQNYDARIRAAVTSCDAFMFLVSDASIKTGAYTLTELGIARQRWPNPAGRVLPVAVGTVDFAALPAYLTEGVTVLQPKGNVAVEAADAVEQLLSQRGSRRLWPIAGVGAAVLIGVGVFAAVHLSSDLPGGGGSASAPAVTTTPTAPSSKPSVTAKPLQSSAPVSATASAEEAWAPPKGYWRIRNATNGTCFTTMASFEDETVLAYAGCTEQRQTIMIEPAENAGFHLVFEHSGMCLTNGPQEGDPPSAAPYGFRQTHCKKGRADQLFKIRPREGSKLFQIEAPSKKCIGNRPSEQGLVHQSCAAVSAQQLFELVQ